MTRAEFEEKYRKWQKGVQRRSEESARRRSRMNKIAIKWGSIFIIVMHIVLGILKIIDYFSG